MRASDSRALQSSAAINDHLPDSSAAHYVHPLVEFCTDSSFAGCTAPTITLEGNPFSASASACGVINNAWNYFDGLGQMLSGIAELSHPDPAYKRAGYLKGMVNIFGGLQLIVFSDNYNLFHYGIQALSSSSSMAAPAFAVSTLCDFITAIINLVNAMKAETIEGWLEENLVRLQYVEQQMEEMEKNQQQKTKAYLEHQEKKAWLIQAIQSRCRVALDQHSQQKNNLELIFKQHYAKGKTENLEEESLRDSTPSEKKRDSEINSSIQKKIDKDILNAKRRVILTGIIFAMMTVAAVSTFVSCPPLALVSTIFCITLATFFLLRNTYRVHNFCQHYFFKPAPQKLVDLTDCQSRQRVRSEAAISPPLNRERVRAF